MTGTATPQRSRLTKEGRERVVLDTAAALFYARGVHEVGMDELVRATGLGKATVYRLYPTKDALVTAYLQRLAGEIGAQIEETSAAHRGDPVGALLAVLDSIEADLRRPGFRGCPFNNASIEFGEMHPARVEARLYRQQLYAQLLGLALAIDDGKGEHLAKVLAVLIDGAYTSAAHLGLDGLADTALDHARALVRAAAGR